MPESKKTPKNRIKSKKTSKRNRNIGPFTYNAYFKTIELKRQSNYIIQIKLNSKNLILLEGKYCSLSFYTTREESMIGGTIGDSFAYLPTELIQYIYIYKNDRAKPHFAIENADDRYNKPPKYSIAQIFNQMIKFLQREKEILKNSEEKKED